MCGGIVRKGGRSKDDPNRWTRWEGKERVEIGRERREGWGKDEDGRGRNGGWDGDEREREKKRWMGEEKGRKEGRKEGRERER